jgi:hypothetical protein
MYQGLITYQSKEVIRGIDHYYTHFRQENFSLMKAGNGKASVNKIELNSGSDKYVGEINFGEELSVILDCDINREISNPSISLTIVTQDLLEVVQTSSYFSKTELHNNLGRIKVQVNLGKIFLNPSIYSLCVTILSDRHGGVLYKCQNICHFKVTGEFIGQSPVQLPGEWKTMN